MAKEKAIRQLLFMSLFTQKFNEVRARYGARGANLMGRFAYTVGMTRRAARSIARKQARAEMKKYAAAAA